MVWCFGLHDNSSCQIGIHYKFTTHGVQVAMSEIVLLIDTLLK
jgi:hypothetical protein